MATGFNLAFFAHCKCTLVLKNVGDMFLIYIYIYIYIYLVQISP